MVVITNFFFNVCFPIASNFRMNKIYIISDNLVIDVSSDATEVSFYGKVRLSFGQNKIKTDQLNLIFKINPVKNEKFFYLNKFIASGSVKIFFSNIIVFADNAVYISTMDRLSLIKATVIYDKHLFKSEKIFFYKKKSQIITESNDDCIMNLFF